MSLLDLGGLLGVGLVLVAYVGAQVSGMDPRRAPSLWLNFGGSGLILLSMTHAFNLSAFVMEAAWAATALFGLGKLVLRARAAPPTDRRPEA